MKKLALFLIVFCGGLAILWILGRRDTERAPVATPPVVESRPGEFTEMPLPQQREGAAGQAVGVFLDGRLDFTQYSTVEGESGKRTLVFHADDVDPLGDNVYDLHQVDIQVFNPETDTLRAHIESPSSRLRLELVDGKPGLGESDRAILSDVVVTLHEGAPVVPLRLRVPRLEWQPKQGLFTSDDHVELVGSGLSAQGTGLVLDSQASSVRLQHAGIVELELEQDERAAHQAGGGARATLSAKGGGPLTVAKLTEGGEARLDVVASEGAELRVTGANPLVIESQTLHMVGRSGTGPSREFELVSAEAREDVVSESGGNRFEAQRADFTFGRKSQLTGARLDGDVELVVRGDTLRAQHADFEFDEHGELTNAEFTGSPEATIELGRHLATGQPEPRAAVAHVTGAGPLQARLRKESPTALGQTEIDFAGPGTLRIPGLELTIEAQESLNGIIDERAKSGRLFARGSAKGTYQQTELASDTFELAYEQDAAGVESARLITYAPTTVTSRQAGEPESTFSAREGLEARVQGRRLTIPIARGVQLSSTGPQAFSASADIVREFDRERRTFEAEGNVAFSDAGGSGTADRIVSHGPDDVEFFGAPGRLAHYERKRQQDGEFDASARALEIRVRGDVLDARGEVVADVQADQVGYKLAGNELHAELAPLAQLAPGAPRGLLVTCNEAVRASFRAPEGDSSVACDRLRIEALLRGSAEPPETPRLRTRAVLAEGNVEIDHVAVAGIRGRGDLFTLDANEHGRLAALPGKRVHAAGRLVQGGLPYLFSADAVEFDRARVEAWQVELGLEESADAPQETGAALVDMRTEHLVADEGQILLDGNAHARGRTSQGETWTIDAGSIRLAGSWADERRIDKDTLDSIEAWDKFSARLGLRLLALGERLTVGEQRARIEGTPASITFEDMHWESTTIEYDMANLLLSTDRGELRSREQGTNKSWALNYTTLQPFAQGDKTILVLRNPVFTNGSDELHADWSLFWIDQAEWRKLGQRTISENVAAPDLRTEVAPEAAAQVQAGFPGQLARFREGPFGKAVSEIYIEGNVEMLEARERIARATAIYLDLVEGHGWVQDADVLTTVDVGGREARLRAKARWMRVSQDFSLRAEKAVITSCDHDEPHYVIESGDLQLTPNPGAGIGWDVAARKNVVRFQSGVRIPLPPLVYATDEEGDPIVESLLGGNSARYGLALRATINGDLGSVGRSVGGVFAKLLDFPETDLRGKWKYDVAYLGSRGLLLGIGLDLRAQDRFRLLTELHGIRDSNEDKGQVRVPTEDRSLIRTWLHSRGRYTMSEREWFDLALSIQSDPGFQAEFFERDYYYYEQKDNYLHWRKATGPYYLDGTAKVLLEDRTDVAELPKFGAFRGATPIASLGGVQLLYSTGASAAYLEREDGDPDYYDPFPDGLGDREVLRFDNEHRLETPIALGAAGLRATPYVSGRITLWSEDAEEEGSASRLGLFGGVDLATTLWKRYGNGSIHSLSPIFGVRSDIATAENGGEPVEFDAVDVPTEGLFVDAGLRSRWFRPGRKDRFDLELRATHASDLEQGADGLQPVAVLGEFLTFAGDVPIGMTHDGRYALDDNATVYSRTYFGFEPVPKLGLEFGYHHGRDADLEELYEAASFETRYRATRKWELQAQQTISIADDRPLNNEFILRRLGHDFVTEFELGYRAGEGASFSIQVIPTLSWKRSGLGLIDRWLGVDR